MPAHSSSTVDPAAPTRRRLGNVGRWVQPWLTVSHRIFEELLGKTRGWMLKPFYELPVVELTALTSGGSRAVPAFLEEICMPPYSFTDKHDDYDSLMKIAAAVNPSLVLELGTAYGNTVANICQQFSRATVVTVNAPPEEISGEIITYAVAREEIGKVYREHGYAARVRQIYCNTLRLDLSEYAQPGMVDLAIIDACHDAHYVVNDFLKVRPYIRPGGVVLLHDTHPSMEGHLVGSYTGCMKLRRRGFDIRHVGGTWWAMWKAPRTEGVGAGVCR